MSIRAVSIVVFLCLLLPISALATPLQIGSIVLTQVVGPSPNGSPGIDELDVFNLSAGLADVTDLLVFGNASLVTDSGTTSLMDAGPGSPLTVVSTTCLDCDTSSGSLQFSSADALTLLNFSALLNTSTVNGGTVINPSISVHLTFGGRMPYDTPFPIYASPVSTGVPEPASVVLMIPALAGSLLFWRRRLAHA